MTEQALAALPSGSRRRDSEALRPTLDARGATDRAALQALVAGLPTGWRYPPLVMVSDALVASDPQAPAMASLTEPEAIVEVACELAEWAETVPAGYEARPFFADVPGALSLLSATLGERPEFAGMPPEDILACLMAQAGERPDASHWEVAWHEELAWGLVLPTTGHFGTIMALAVRPEARGRGLGRALHAHALTVLKREGMTRYVDHVDARSAAMLAICATHGCRVVDRFWQFRMASPAKP